MSIGQLVNIGLAHQDCALCKQRLEDGRVLLRPEVLQRPRSVRRWQCLGVDAVLDGNRKPVKSPQWGSPRALQVSSTRGLQHHLAIERAEGIQALERLRSIKKGAS